jgi:hypothetical protein
MTRLVAPLWRFSAGVSILLGLVTAVSLVHGPQTDVVNLAMALVFLGIGLVLLWRLQALEAVLRLVPESEASRRLLRAEAVISVPAFVVGSAFAMAALLRAIGEGFPVFG